MWFYMIFYMVLKIFYTVWYRCYISFSLLYFLHVWIGFILFYTSWLSFVLFCTSVLLFYMVYTCLSCLYGLTVVNNGGFMIEFHQQLMNTNGQSMVACMMLVRHLWTEWGGIRKPTILIFFLNKRGWLVIVCNAICSGFLCYELWSFTNKHRWTWWIQAGLNGKQKTHIKHVDWYRYCLNDINMNHIGTLCSECSNKPYIYIHHIWT